MAIQKSILVSGASISGLTTAYCLMRGGHRVSIVEIADRPRTQGGAVDIVGKTIETVKHMGLFEVLKAKRIKLDLIEIKKADGTTAHTMTLPDEQSSEEIEIEREKFVEVLLDQMQGKVEFIFGNRITDLQDTGSNVIVTFQKGEKRSYDLVVGCDGMHSGVRKIAFGKEENYTHFLGAYFSITIVDKLLIPARTMQMFSIPNQSIMLNAYNNKTDIIFNFNASEEIPYDYRDIEAQRKIILTKFADNSWRSAELLEEIQNARGFYFDKFGQIKMPAWSQGRIALVGDAAYCASPAAGMGGSLAMEGAATLADAIQDSRGDHKLAFETYEKNLRSFIEEVQTRAAQNVKQLIPATAEDIEKRQSQGFDFD